MVRKGKHRGLPSSLSSKIVSFCLVIMIALFLPKTSGKKTSVIDKSHAADNSAETSARFLQGQLVSVYDEEPIKEGPLSIGDTPFDDTAHYFGVEKIELHQYDGKDDGITAMRLTYREDGQGPLNGRYSKDSTKESFALSSDEEFVSVTVKIDAEQGAVKWINFITTAGRSYSMGKQEMSGKSKKNGGSWMEETYTAPSDGGWILGGIHGFLKEDKGNSKSLSSLGVYWIKKSEVRAVAGGNILIDVGSQFLSDASITQLVPEITTVDDAVAWIELDLIENPRNPVIMWQINPSPGQPFLVLHRQRFLEQEYVISRSAQAYAEETVAMVREKAAGGVFTRRAYVQTTDNSSPTTVFYMVGTICAGGGSDDDICNVGSECCSGLCNDGTCVHCLPELLTQCASDLDCCEGLYCTDKLCIQAPSSSPSAVPSLEPSSTPSAVPSAQPSSRPSSQPSSLPSNNPSTAPSDVPSASPSSIPSDGPSTIPSSQPSSLPSDIPSSMPSMEPSVLPSSSPTLAPRFDYESCEDDSHCIGGACTTDRVCGSPLKVYLSKELGSPTEIPVASAEAYGTNQDGGGGIVVSQIGLEMYGNSWRSFALKYQVTKKTVLEFDFALTAEAEGHAICLDEDNNEDVELPFNRRCFLLAGSQSSTWEEVWKLAESADGHYKIEIGAPTDQSPAYINPGTIINYLAFIQDNDSDSEIGRSSFSNIRIYEDNGDKPASRISQVLCEKRNGIEELYQDDSLTRSQFRSMLRWTGSAEQASLGACPYSNSFIRGRSYGKTGLIRLEICRGLFGSRCENTYVASSESLSLSYLPMKKSCSYVDEEAELYDFSTSSPTITPTSTPTSTPSKSPSSSPSKVPSGVPSLAPSTVSPSSIPSHVHSVVPSRSPISTEVPQNDRRALSYTDEKNFMFEFSLPNDRLKSVQSTLCLGNSPLDASRSTDLDLLGINLPADVDSIIFMFPCDGSDPVAAAISQIRQDMAKAETECEQGSVFTQRQCKASCPLCDLLARIHGIPSTPADGRWVPHNSVCPCDEEPDPADGVCKLKDQCFYYPDACPENSKCDSSGTYCECNSGFLSDDDIPVKIVDSDSATLCIPNEESDQDVTGESFLMTVHNREEATQYRIMCTRLGEADLPPLSVAPHDNSVVVVADRDAELFQYNFTGLLPGKKYRAKLEPLDDDGKEKETNFDLSTSAVTHCCCDCPLDNKNDVSGRPDRFQVKQQSGQITFAFKDNSQCAEAYAFTRTDLVEEFDGIDDESKKTVFTSNYYYYPKKMCGRAPITPGLGASDDLRISKLLVGTGYRYCVRAVAQFYSDHLSEEGETLYSSDETCQVHYIKWQASIAGKITTEPEAGSLPIETVLVTWELLDLDKVNVISSGDYTTKKDGGFAITFNETSGLLENDIDYPVRIKFFKVSEADPKVISHSFLCNQGTIDCTDAGTIVYLRHLQFEAPVHVYDDTSVPFTGRIIIGDTASDESGEGCAIFGAQVCLVDKHARTGDTQGICVLTRPNGDFEAPAVIGSKVSVQVNYKNHTFLPTFENIWDYDDGIVVDISRRYERHDFMDMTKAKLFVEVAGGLCDHTLGTSKIKVKVANCKWSQIITQDAFKAAHTVPGHVLTVRVVDVIDPTTKVTRNPIQEWFATDDMEQSVNLLEIAMEDDVIGGGDDSPEASEMEQEEEALQETRETVRFQFDGDLEISFVAGTFVQDEKGDCDDSTKSPEGDTTYSLHVMPTGSVFIPSVFLKYKLLDTDPPLYCDILSEDMQVRMVNKVGVDSYQFGTYSTTTTDEDFESLVACSDRTFANRDEPPGEEDVNYPLCLVNVTHDSEGRNAHAIPSSKFKAGRPNYLPDFKKTFTIEVQDRDITRRHVAEFIVTGDFDLGKGPSFALPTYKPILVLRDPPGGLSTASYTNVQTTIAVTMENTKVMGGFDAGLDIGITGGASLETCAGGGFGVMLLACLAISKASFKLDATVDGGGDFMVTDTTDTYTGKYTTTWSYTTSDDPLHAGRLSDTMVVPNLNVEYHLVSNVQWTNCKADATEEVKFDIKSKKNMPTLSFLSVHNIETYKIKGLEKGIQLLQDELESGATDPGKNETELEQIRIKNATLQDALKGWNDAINEYEATNSKAREKTLTIAPADWFGKYAAIRDHGVNEPIPKTQWSSLAPERLVKRAEALPYDYVKEAGLGDKQDLKVTNRIQFSGGGSTMTFSMDHEQIEEAMQLDPDAAPIDNSEGRTEVGIETDNSILAFAGLDIEAHAKVHVDTSHSKMRTDAREDQTGISFTLGDSDREDEFVTDVYIDPKHGTFVFPLISGRSKGPHEVNTEWGEKPLINMEMYPTRPVLPDDEIVVQLRIANTGASASGFTAFLDHRHNPRGLQFRLSGESLAVPIGYWLDPGEIFEVYQDLTIKRGPQDFLYEPAIMWLTSEWDGYGDEGVETEIYNHIHEGKKWIKFEQPCPKVEWAGTIGRERSFLINSLQSSLKMTIFNPSHALGSFEELSNSTRLNTVYIRYRLIGAVDWSIAYDLAAPAKEEADAETSYGYLNRIWDMGKLLTDEGTYELKVETVCKTVTGAPDDFNAYRTQSIIGVIDRFEPKLYGSPLPLRDLLIPGEEVVLMFTEPIMCTKPYRFELDVVVAGINGTFDERNLNIICEERKLAFQFDQTNVRYDVLMGRQMDVTVKGVSDRNHNTMNENAPPIMFSKKIANLNLDEVSTSFTFTLNTASCTLPVDDTEAIQSQIANILTVYDSNRINIISAVCQGTTTEATVTIGPSASPGLRRKLSENITHSLDLFYSLQQVSKNETHGTRMLADDDGTKPVSFAVHNLRLIPGTSDAALFEITAYQVRKEEMIRQGKGDTNSFIQEERMMRVGEKLEEQMKLWSEQSASAVRSDDAYTLDVVLEEMRLEREEMRKVLSEKSASAAGTDYDHTLSAVLEEMRLEREEMRKTMRLEREEMRKTLHRMVFIAIGVAAVSSVLLYSRKS